MLVIVKEDLIEGVWYDYAGMSISAVSHWHTHRLCYFLSGLLVSKASGPFLDPSVPYFFNTAQCDL